jgi:hypothetical protein
LVAARLRPFPPLAQSPEPALIPTLLLRIHHAAIICADDAASKRIHTDTLGLTACRWRSTKPSPHAHEGQRLQNL